MRKFFLIIIILLTLVCPVFSSDEDALRWKKVTENHFIDADGIIGLDEIYGFSFILKSYNKGQYEPVNGKFIRYTLANYTIDCAKLSYKIGVIDSYDDNDNFVNGDYNRYAKFQPIVQGTAISSIAGKLCRPLK